MRVQQRDMLAMRGYHKFIIRTRTMEESEATDPGGTGARWVCKGSPRDKPWMGQHLQSELGLSCVDPE